MATNAEANAAGYITPGNNNLISEGDDAISNNARVTLDLFNGIKWDLPPLANGDDLNNARAKGLRYVPGWGTIGNKPAGASGGALLTSTLTTTLVRHTWLDDAGWTASRAQTTDGGWQAWSIERWELPNLPSSVSLDTVTEVGVRYVTSWGNNPGRPDGAGSGLLWTTHAAGDFLAHTWLDDTGWITRRLQTSDGGWQAWASSRESAGAGPGHITRVSEWLSKSSPVYTEGKGAIAFTFDHGLSKFKAAGLPAQMSNRGFKYGLALNSATLSSAENSGATTADILSWAGAEIWNHGRTHTAASNSNAVRTEIISGKTELESLFGREVFGYIPAGVGSTGLDGFDGGSTPDQWADTLAGQLILQHHAVTTGYLGSGGIRQLTGTVQQGISRFTIDTLTVARIKQQIDLAETNRVGVVFMLHPNLLDTPDHLTTAQFLEVLTYAKTRETAGGIRVLSPGEIARADAGPSAATTAATTRLLYDSGVRNVSSLLINGWTGTLYLLIRGDDVILTAEGLDGRNATSGRFINLPLGAQPRPRGSIYNTRARGAVFLANGTPRRWDSADQGVTTIRDHVTGTNGDVLYGDMWMKTIDPPPATPPGIAA